MGTKQNFDKCFRLRSVIDFKRLTLGSKKISSDKVIVYHKKIEDLRHLTRIGISVSRKIGNSVLRNKLKRIIREFFRKSEYKFMGEDVLFVIKKQNNYEKLYKNHLITSLSSVFETLKCDT